MRMRLGQSEQEAAFIAALASGRMPHAWLLTGRKGIGKAMFAHDAAAFIIADGDRRASDGAMSLQLPANEPALALIEAGSHSEYRVLRREIAKPKKKGEEPSDKDVARNVTIEQVRQLLSRMRTRPVQSCWRAVIVDSIDDLERGAANALLKTLEEPPANTIFLLVSHNPGRLLPTIRSRCRVLRFNALDDDVMASALSDVAGANQPILARLSQGAPGEARRLAALNVDDLAATIEAIRDSRDPDNRLRTALARSLAGMAQRERLDLMLALAVDEATNSAYDAQGASLDRALAARERLIDLRRSAIASSEDPVVVAFTAASIIATLTGNARAA
jgi:DNA polymerase III subunit delta'